MLFYKVKSIIKKSIGIYYFFIFLFFEFKKILVSDIVFFLPYFHTGGAERVHYNIVKAQVNKKCYVIFTDLSATKNFYHQFKNLKHAYIYELNPILNKKNKLINKVLEKFLVAAINNSKKVRTVFGSNSNYFYIKILPKLNKSIKKIDLIHAILPDEHRRSLFIESAKFIDIRVVITNKSKIDLIEIYKSEHLSSTYNDRIIKIENAVYNSSELKFVYKDFSKIKIGFIGRWSKEKRPNLFLEVAKLVNQNYSKFDFIMAGTGMKTNLSQINDAGVSFLGEITDNYKINNLYRELDIIVITSEYEGFPMVVMESMFYGVIPICTNVGGIYEHITHMNNGILIDNLSEKQIINDLYSHILKLSENIQLSNTLSKNAMNYSNKNFLIDRFNKEYQMLLN